MSQPYIGEIRIFGGNFAPQGWAFCDGSTLPISGNDTLFQLIGTTYGGDGQSTFALPDLRGRAPVGVGQGPGLQNYTVGQREGAESVALSVNQIPSHGIPTSTANRTRNRPSAALARGGSYGPVVAADSPNLVGGGQAHDNMAPYLTVSFIISMFGIFPSSS